MWCLVGRMRIDNYCQKYTTKTFPGSRVGLMLDMDVGTVEYVINDVRKGIAYKSDDLKSGEYYFDVSLFYKGD